MSNVQKDMMKDTLAGHVEDILNGMRWYDAADIEHIRDAMVSKFAEMLDEVKAAVQCPNCGSDETEVVPGGVVHTKDADVYLDDMMHCGQCGLIWKWGDGQ